MMRCMHCGVMSGAEHYRSCPMFEPPLTQEELREVRRLLAFSRGAMGGVEQRVRADD